jgi:predicted Zn-ribbon and HTH transcriptional regulator
MTRRSVFAVLGGLFAATAARAQKSETANVMYNECVVSKYALSPAECQECGAGFVYYRHSPTHSHRPNFCPNCGRRNIGLLESDDGSGAES